MYIAIDVSKEMEYIFLRSFLYDLFVPHFFFLYCQPISLQYSCSRSSFDRIYSRDWNSLVHFVRNWRAGLSKVEWKQGPTSKLSDRLRALLSSSLFVFPTVFSKIYPQLFETLEIVTRFNEMKIVDRYLVIYSKKFSIVRTESFSTSSG